jgi:AbrB family looped-hinge helix DNA binding protein
MKATIDDTGRILLPEDLRVQLGVEPGDDVVLEKQGDEWVIRCPHEDGGLCWEGSVLVHKGTSASNATIETAIDEVRRERFDQQTEDLAK